MRGEPQTHQPRQAKYLMEHETGVGCAGAPTRVRGQLLQAAAALPLTCAWLNFGEPGSELAVRSR